MARVNPRQACDFPESVGVLAKIDQVDAGRLRDFADALARHPARQQYITPVGATRTRQIGKLVGVALLADDSGNRRGKQRIWGGRANLRAVVYMAGWAYNKPSALRLLNS